MRVRYVWIYLQEEEEQLALANNDYVEWKAAVYIDFVLHIIHPSISLFPQTNAKLPAYESY